MAGESSRPVPTSLPRIGSYDLMQPLGSGGMSSVFRARHVENGLEVAIKILPRNLAKNTTVLQRFLREAKSAEALQHPNIVAIYDRGVDQGRHYLVLEYVAGGDLHDRVRSGGPLPTDQATAIVRSVAEALRYAAGQGLIHRDIKPANLLLDTNGQVKVADLGLALHAEDEDERVTREGTTVGTVDYMSPEQARDSRATSIRSDIYSLGCTFVFLLTGQPPFPGGDVAEKLNRHINTPPPDVRERRSDVSPALASLITRMLAKKPEARFESYDDLIAAIDRLGADTAPLPVQPAQESGAAPSLTALFDDEGDDEVIELEPFEPSPPPERGNGRRPNDGAAKPRKPVVKDEPLGAAPLPLADLIPLDGEDQHALPAPPRTRPAPALNRPRTPEPEELLPELVPIDDEEPEEDDGPAYVPLAGTGARNRPLPAAVVSSGSGGRMSQSERSWIMMCVLLGLSLILVVIVVDQVFRASQNSGPDVVDAELASPDATGAEEVIPGGPVPGVAPNAAPSPEPVVATPPRPKPPVTEVRPPRPPWVEPTDPAPESVAESPLAPSIESQYVPDWVTVTPRVPNRVVVVRRVPDPRQPEERPSIRMGLEVTGGGAVEVADNGVFFENEFRIGGDGRWIRARKGYRPIVNLLPPRIDSTQQGTAWLDLGDRSLTLEGLDLILDVSSLRPTQTTLFAVRGGTLILRDCTLTLVNRVTSTTLRGFTLVKTTPGVRPSRVAFDRTYVRGAYTTGVDVSGGPAEVALVRSVLINGQGTVATYSTPQPAAGMVRRLSFFRSITLTWGPAVEFNDTPRGGKPRAVSIRALESTFAHFQTSQGSAFLLGRGEASSPIDVVDWKGDGNVYAGWSSWLSSGSARPTRVANVRAVRTTWPSTDATSEESSRSWPQLPPSPDRVPLDALRPLAPNRLAVLTRVAAPNPRLHERTVEEFARPDVPSLASAGSVSANAGAALAGQGSGTGPGAGRPNPAQPATPGIDPNRPGYQSGMLAGFGGRTAANSAADSGPIGSSRSNGGTSAPSTPDVLATAAPIPGTRELVFDTGAPSTRGDLGRFLAENTQPGDSLVRVRVKGSGSHVWSPVALPVGVSLEVLVEPGPGGVVPTWSAPNDARGEALIDVRQAHVLLSHVRLTRDGGRGLKHLVRVEGGHLALHRCQLRAPGTVETEGGGLLALVAPGTGPLPSRPGGSFWPFDRLVDRPTLRIADSVLQTGGRAIAAHLGRGLVAVSQSVVIAGDACFALRPGAVARSRFDCDLRLDHVTLASEDAFVEFGPWPGTAPGPGRPWVVSTSDCVFFGQYERSESDPVSVLLRSDPEALARGAVVWQSLSDDLEVSWFIATGEGNPGLNRRPDLRSQWASFWGDHHARNTIGPRAPSSQPARRPIGRLRPHEVEPGDLALDPDYPTSHAPDTFGADLARLGIAPAPGSRRRPGP